MVEARKSADIGMKRGRILSNLPQPQQLDVISEGLPILMKSAGELLEASKALGEHARAATILTGHALEEVAKILILMDIVRCPPKIRGERIGPMMGWFYDHLARLIYLNAQSWRPTDVNELQSYVDDHRKSHSLEGYIGEYIIPNWTAWSRESMLYADIATYEDGAPVWNSPSSTSTHSHWDDVSPLQVCQALSDMGAFTRRGLDIVSSVWSQIDFEGDQQWSNIERLTYDMLMGLQKAGLITESAHDAQLAHLYHRWQLPMYRIDFKRLEVSLEQLRSEQEALMWAETGY